MQASTPEQKAWQLVKDTLSDDESYFALRQGMPIQLRGSEGTLFILYPSGRFVKVGLQAPELGRIREGSEFAGADYLATIIAWIKFNEPQLQKNWGCGNFNMREPAPPDLVERTDWDRSGGSSGLAKGLLGWVLMIGTMASIPFLLTHFGLVPSIDTAQPTSELFQTIIDFMPMIMILGMIGIILSMVKSFSTSW